MTDDHNKGEKMDQPPAIVTPQKPPTGHDMPRYEVLPNGNVRIIYSPPTGIAPPRS